MKLQTRDRALVFICLLAALGCGSRGVPKGSPKVIPNDPPEASVKIGMGRPEVRKHWGLPLVHYPIVTDVGTPQQRVGRIVCIYSKLLSSDQKTYLVASFQVDAEGSATLERYAFSKLTWEELNNTERLYQLLWPPRCKEPV